jgi:putative FmdB family regulatory protein
MPIYEYECLECGVHFDRLQRFGAPDPRTCPQGHSRVHRLLGQPAIIFKGPGFYITDHGRNGKGRNGHSRPSRKETETGGSKQNPAPQEGQAKSENSKS